ncbi:MAG: UbiD family decarboxylase [Gammaproteobacteria bacterium]|nr:MAG: UbiD family decarboxylase [Gammaproteobacteria bacterium]
MSEKTPAAGADPVSRRTFLNTAAAGTAIAALSAAGYTADARGAAPFVGAASAAALKNAPQPPFDSFRDWIAALDAHGLLLRFDRIDQDQYQIPALFFKATDMYTMYGAPCMLFEEVKIDGKWVKGPVIVNTQGHWNTDAIIWGLPVIPGDHYATYRGALAYLQDMLAKNDGKFPEIPPVEVSRDQAPCKEVVLTSDEIDLTKFAFVKTNPADGGRYVNTGSHFMDDPELGPNFGTYRCQIKGPRKLGINPEHNQTGYKMLMAAKERGEKSMTYSIVLGQDPVIWLLSGTRLAARGFGPKPKPADELAMAGGMRGKPIEIVKSELTDIMIPAHAEFVIEGEVPLDESTYEPEGPFGEMFGYLGPIKEANFVMHVKKVTHRRNPWFMNALTGMQRGMVTAPMDAAYSIRLKEMVPQFVEYTNPQDTMGIVVMSIDKTGPGQGLEGGMKIAARNPIAKIVIVVDKDINIFDRTDVMFAVGSRWQPNPASTIIDDTFGLMTDPSQVKYARTSKIVIDATRQLPGEGGKEVFPKTNRELLKEGAPDAFAQVQELFGEALANWKCV